MNALIKRVDAVATVALIGLVLAVVCLAGAIESCGRASAAGRLWVSRALLRSGLRPRASDVALHDLRVPVSGLDVDGEDGEALDLAAFAEYGGVPFSERVRR